MLRRRGVRIVTHRCLVRALLTVVVAAGACSEGGGDGPQSFGSLYDAFPVEDSITLEEVPGDTIAEIGHVEISPDGRLLMSDRFLPRVRLYGSDGRLLASHGRFGDGPFEYRRILGVAQNLRGNVVVHSQGVRGYTVLTEHLEPDTVRLLEPDYVWALKVGRHSTGVVQQLGGAGGQLRQVFRDSSGSVRFSVDAGPDRIGEMPYWGSVVSYYSASVGDSLVVGNSLLYPFTLIGSDGRALGEFGTPPGTYREVPELEPGELAFGGASSRLTSWLESFDVVTGLHLVGGRWLVVPHGRIQTDRPGPPFQHVDETIDVYDVRTLSKTIEGVPVPAGARILGGGPFLHVLVGMPPEPWTILRLRVADVR